MSEDLDSRRIVPGLVTGGRAPFGPSSCLMPDLSDIKSPVMLDYLLNATYRGAGPTDPKARAYLHLFIRVSDKAILEYETARTVLTEFCSERNRSSLYLRTVGHLENCIGSMRRVELILTRLKAVLSDPGMPRDARNEVERHLAFVSPIRNLIEHMDDWIKKDKLVEGNLIEHMDDWIKKDKLVEGDLITLALLDKGDGVRIASYTVQFDDLASLLRSVHTLASWLADYQEGPQTTI